METKVILFLACCGVASAGLLPEKTLLGKLEEFDSHPSYKFNYNVDDSITGDVKAQTETRDGDFVKGQYSLNDADGYKRIVDYTSDAVNGFNAVVRRERLNAPKVVVQQPIGPKSSPLIAPKAVTPVKPQQFLFKSFPQMPTVIRTYSAPTTVVHHQPTVYHHAAPHTVHLTPAAHIVHAAPSTTLVKTYHQSPAVVHHAPTVVHHHSSALVKSSIATPHHVSYVHYH